MKAIRAIKLKIGKDRHGDLLSVSSRYIPAINWLSGVVFDTREVNSNRLGKAHYRNLRGNFGLTSQIALSLCKVVSSSYRSMKTQGRWRKAKYKKPCLPVVWRRDFNVTKKGITLWGKPLVLMGQLLPKGLWLDSKIRKEGESWFLILSHEIDIPDTKTSGSIVGVDFGVKRLMVATNSDNAKTFFFHGGKLNHLRTGIRRRRAKIQSVGTRSSRRLLVRLSKREKAVTEHLLHVASKALVKYAVDVNARKIVMEDLKNIQDSSLRKGKSFREKIHRWPYARGQFLVSYKAQERGISTELVSPRNTSRGCPRCGHVKASNRKGFIFRCGKCGHRGDADRNASENIRLRSIAIGHNSTAMGSCKPPKSSEPIEIGGACSHVGLVTPV